MRLVNPDLFGYSPVRQRSGGWPDAEINRPGGMVTPQQIKEWIESELEGSSVVINGDGHHFEALIVSEAFEGQSSVQRHQMVYRALGDKMKSEIHALSMQTRTPGEIGPSAPGSD